MARSRRLVYTRIGRLASALIIVSGLIALATINSRWVRQPTRQPVGSERGVPPRALPATGMTVLDTVGGRSTDVWVLRFTGMQPARIVIETPLGRALQCRVLTTAGNTVTNQEPVAGACSLSWTPAHTGAYQVEVRNTHMQALPYVLRKSN